MVKCREVKQLFVIWYLAGAGIVLAAEVGVPVNYLVNSSFEVGLTDWELRSGTVNGVRRDDTPHGTTVIRFERSGALSGPWINLEPRRVPYEFAIWARATHPGGKLTLELCNALNRNLQRRNKIEAWSTQKTFGLTDQWQRYSLIADELRFSWRDAYRPLILVSGKGGVELDAVSLSLHGKDATYQPAETLSMGMGTQNPSNIFPVGAVVEPFVALFANGTEQRPRSLHMTVKDSDGNDVFLNRYMLDWDSSGHARVEATIENLPVGFYRVWLIARDATGKTALKRDFAVAVVTSRLNDPADANSPFGCHGLASRTMRDAKLVGVSFVRKCGFPSWDRIESKQGHFRWPVLSDIELAEKLGQVVQANPLYVPEWARSKKERPFSFRPQATPPEDPALFGKFCAEAVERYGHGVKLWEIWNEPNAKSYFNGTVAEYVEVAKYAYKFIKAKDPKAQVWTCSTWNVDFKWFDEAMGLGILKNTDALAPHGYRKTAPEGWESDLKKLCDKMREHGGPIVPLVVTEFGYQGTDHPDKTTPYLPELKDIDGYKPNERQQAALMVRTYVVTMANGVRALVWYKWDEQRGNNFGPDTHGLNKVLPIPQPKAGAAAYNTMATCLRGAKNGRRIERGSDDIYVYRFDNKDGSVWVAWTTSDDPKSLNLKVGDVKTLQTREMLGRSFQADVVDGTTKLSLTQEPVFLIR